MKAVRIHEHGGVETLRYEEAPEPTLADPNDAIVKLKAASLNHIDIWVRRGLTGIEIVLPHILGGDGAGVIAEVGDRVQNIKTGDAVCLYPPSGCGRCEFCITDREYMCVQLRVLGERENGTYAEYARVRARNCFPIPPDLSFEQAAAFPLVYITVWRMLVTNAQLKPGEHVLILGIGGGVATAALQLAAYIGTHIIVTSSSDEKLEKAKALGSEHGINYKNADFAKEVRRLTGKRGVRRRRRLRGRRWLDQEFGVAGQRRKISHLRRHRRGQSAHRHTADLLEQSQNFRLDLGRPRGVPGSAKLHGSVAHQTGG